MALKTVAMILAGGKGTRLKALTKKVAKPAVGFGGKYRIIDFTLSNVANSGIPTVGVLTQYESVTLNNYIKDGAKWGFNGIGSLCSLLSPRQTEEGSSWYEGTADAIYQNLEFLDEEQPDYVLILSGDHIYKTTYNEMIEEHIKNNAVCTISAIKVDIKEASRFGILEVDENNMITKFVEKPKEPKSDLASMGIYVFSYKELKKALIKDHKDENSEHDFGKNIIPTMLEKGEKLLCYKFSGYWKDVGTLDSLHLANLELLPSNSSLDPIRLSEEPLVYGEDTSSRPTFFGKSAKVSDCLINQGAKIYGNVSRSVISNEVVIKDGAIVKDSVLMANVVIEKGARVENAIIAPNTVINENEKINLNNEEVVLIDKERSLQ